MTPAHGSPAGASLAVPAVSTGPEAVNGLVAGPSWRIIEIHHDTRYHYAQPVAQSHHLAHLKPLADAHQALLDFTLGVTPEPAAWRDQIDAFGNACLHFALGRPHETLLVQAFSRVRVHERFADLVPAQSPACGEVARRLRYVARAPFDPAVAYVQPSPYVPRLEALRAYAQDCLLPERPVAEAAMDLMETIHRDFRYSSLSTQVDTPVQRAFEQRCGVCQDFAHVMIGALRMWGLPARYVSGYLLTQPAGGGTPLIGADASHAWVQVYAPGTPGLPPDGWLDLDPTNRLIPSRDHVRLAIGRDFGDVTPLRGVIRGGGQHTLSVGVTTRAVPAQTLSGPVGPVVAL